MLTITKSLPAYFAGIFRKPTAIKIGSALFTQSVLSLTNFFVGISVARYASKNEYGIYVILFSIMAIMGTYQNALVNTPLTVLVHKKDEKEQFKLLSGMAFGQGFAFIPILPLSIFIAWTMDKRFPDLNLVGLSLMLGVVTLVFLFREFVRTVNYYKLRINFLVEMDAIFLLVVGIGIVLISNIDMVTSSTALVVLGIGYLLSATYSEIRSRDKKKWCLAWIREAFSETWEYSRWALVGVTSDIFKNRGYIYIVTAMLGLEVIAEVSAARLLLMPIGLLIGSSGRITLAKGAEIYNTKGLDKFRKFFAGITILLVFVWGGYSIVLFLFSEPIMSILGQKYMKSQGYLVVWGIFFFFLALRFPISNTLYIFKEFKAQARIDIICAAVTVIGCLILTNHFGGYGTILSLALGEFTMILISLPLLIGHLSERLATA